jgi:hypothetical protein
MGRESRHRNDFHAYRIIFVWRHGNTPVMHNHLSKPSTLLLVGLIWLLLLLLLLILVLSGRGALIRIDNLAHLLLVLALASLFVSCPPLPRARVVGLSVLLTGTVVARRVV